MGEGPDGHLPSFDHHHMHWTAKQFLKKRVKKKKIS